MRKCRKHNRWYSKECPDCWADRQIEEQNAKEEEQLRQDAAKKRRGYPCLHGDRCEWATHNGKSVTCSRLLGGCLKA